MKKFLLLLFLAAAPLSAQSWNRIDLWWQRMDGGEAVPDGGGSGVTSVGVSVPSTFTISGTPVTSSGTIALAWASQLQNLVLASPDGAPGVPTFREIVPGDCPTCTFGGSGAVATDVIWNAAGDLVYGTGSDTAVRLAPGTATQVLHGGTTPSWAVVSLTADVSGTLAAGNGGTGITSLGTGVATFLGTPSGANLASALTSALPVTDGGTGLAAGNSGGIPYFSGSTTIASSAALDEGGVLYGGGTGVSPAATTVGNARAVLTSGGAGQPPAFAALRFTKSITVETPGAAEKIPIFTANENMTITDVCATLIGSATPSVTPNVKYGSDLSAAGTSVTTTPSAVTSVTTADCSAALNNVTVSSGEHIWLITTAQSGTVGTLTVTVTLTVP